MSIGLTQMTSLLSLNSTMKGMETMNTARVGVKGNLLTETDAEKKAALEERLKSIEQGINDSAKGIMEQIAADREKIRAEEAEQTRQEEKAAEKTDAAKTEQSGEVSNSDSGVKVTTDPTTGITEPVDVLEFSPEGMEAAAATATPVKVATSPATPQVNTPSTGTVVDKKV